MPGKPRVSPARADAFLCSWLSHQDVELTLMAFLCSNPLEKQLFWWLSVPAVTMACLGEQPALMPIIPLALFLTESDHSSINLKIATIFVVDIINLLCVYVPSLFQALMLHHSPADPLLLWHKKTLSKTWLFHKKSTNYRLCVLCSVSSCQAGSPVTDSSLMWSVGFGASSQSVFGWVDVEGGCSQAARTGGDTGHKDSCDGWVGGCVGFVMQ